MLEGGTEMRIYLAGRYSRRGELQGYASDLAYAGIGQVNSRWLTEDHEWDGAEDQMTLARRLATDDQQDLAEAGIVIVFTEPPAPGGRNRGGRHVEFGRAGPPRTDSTQLDLVGHIGGSAQRLATVYSAQPTDLYAQAVAMLEPGDYVEVSARQRVAMQRLGPAGPFMLEA